MNSNQFENFENNGLKIDKERVLTFSHLSCPLECKYCFVEGMASNQQENVAYLNEEQFELFKQLPEQVKLIMLGCDTEFFQNKENAIKILQQLSELGRDISVITKLSLPVEFIKELKVVDNRLKENGNFLTFSVSLPFLNSYKKWEPMVPSPQKRIETLASAFKEDLKTLVAIRPLFPSVPDEELEEIILATKDFCAGYYSGPLYLKTLDLLKDEDVSDLIVDKVQPDWMPKGNIFYRVERKNQLELLRNILNRYSKKLFEGAAEAIQQINNQ